MAQPLEALVALLVAVAVVVALEMVDVDEQQRQRQFFTEAACKLALERLVERATIGEAGETVG